MTRTPRFVYNVEGFGRNKICVSLPQPGHGLYYSMFYYDIDEWEEVKAAVLRDIELVDKMIARAVRE